MLVLAEVAKVRRDHAVNRANNGCKAHNDFREVLANNLYLTGPVAASGSWRKVSKRKARTGLGAGF